MPEATRLHLDADTSRKALHSALIKAGFDVSRTPNSWMALDASDLAQLQGASSQGRVIFTFNIADFCQLAKVHPEHAGILLAHQTQWTLSSLLKALKYMLLTTDAEMWTGQLRWLNDWDQ